MRALLTLLAYVLVTSTGCAITASGIYPGLAPGDEVQTIDVTVIGISLDATRDSLDIGYKKLRLTRVPSFEEPVLIPSVEATTTAETSIHGGTTITDRLEVGTYDQQEETPCP